MYAFLAVVHHPYECLTISLDPDLGVLTDDDLFGLDPVIESDLFRAMTVRIEQFLEMQVGIQRRMVKNDLLVDLLDVCLRLGILWIGLAEFDPWY